MDDYIAKPVTSEKLRAVLQRWVAPPAAPTTGAGMRVVAVPAPDGAIDTAVLAGLRDLQEEGEPDLVRQLIALFLAGTPPRLDALRAAAAGGAATALAREAHALKGSCASLGAHAMARLCEELEALDGPEDLARATATVDRLATEYDRVRAALSAAVAA
jgi:HPt (histidine-containing phosphotransfer) domain-containing protein